MFNKPLDASRYILAAYLNCKTIIWKMHIPKNKYKMNTLDTSLMTKLRFIILEEPNIRWTYGYLIKGVDL